MVELKPISKIFLRNTLFVQMITERRVVSEGRIASSGKTVHHIKGKNPLKEESDSALNCFRLVLKSGEEIDAKDVLIGGKYVQYKNCNADSSTIHQVKIKDVFLVKYPDGRNEVITPFAMAGEDPTEEGRHGGGLSIASLGLALISTLEEIGVFFFPLSVIFAIIALANNYKYRSLSVLAIIISIIVSISILTL